MRRRLMRAVGFAAFALACGVALSGCATPVPREATPDANVAHAAYEARAAALAGWTANGRLTVRVLADLTADRADRDRGIAARMRWRQTGERYRITLSNNLGQGLLQLAGAPGGVTLRTAEGERFIAADPETLLHRQVGWSVPLGGLRYWVLGIVDPRAAPSHVDLDEFGRLRVLEQSGWRIDYLEYARAGSEGGFEGELPARLALSSDRVRASLSVSRWQL